MTISARTTRIIAASGLALSFIGVSYVISGPTIFTNNTANAESTQALLAAYAAKDTDGDGLPDWQEALYGTDPNKAISNSYGIPDGQAAQKGLLTPTALKDQLPTDQATTTLTADDLPGPLAAPGTITDEFSKDFFQSYMEKSGGQPLSADDDQALLTQLLGEFQTKAAAAMSSSYTAVSIHPDSQISESSYAGAVESILQAHDVPADANQPLPLMEALIENNDESARPKLKVLADSYKAIASDLLKTHVPPQLAAEHLQLLQAFDSLAKTTAVVVNYEKDPVATLGAIGVYQPASAQAVAAFKAMATALIANGEPAAGTPGAMIVSIARSAETK
jgi:hypothetical protein